MHSDHFVVRRTFGWRVRQFFRRSLANVYYLRRPFLQFLPLLTLLIVVLVAGSFCFYHLYDQWPDTVERSYVLALYVTYSLVFMEHLYAFPEHPVLQLYYFGLPLLGLVVILDGLVRFGYHVSRHGFDSPDWVKAMVKTYRGHVVLCGLGRVGLRTLQQLLRLGENVAVLEKDADCPNLAFARKHQVPVLIGNGREEGIFEALNIKDAKSIILATNDDLANLEMALDARKDNEDIRVVMRMFDQELASKIRDAFDIHLAFSTSAQAAPLFATCSSDRSIENSFYVGDRLLVVADLVVNGDSKLIGQKIADIGAEHQIFFLSHRRDEEETHFPTGDTEFVAGDHLIVQTGPDTLRKLHGWNRDKKPY